MGAGDDSDILLDGPWVHRDVSTGGVRLHVAEAGRGPLVLLLHGFPEFWWCWRAQLPALAAAGYRAVAPDLRGYGASDKPPRGYDALTLAADVAGLVRALGERSAVLVGHDWGGLLAWVVASVHPTLVRRLVVVGMPHPLRLRAALLHTPAQRRASRHLAAVQLPRLPERWLTRDGAANVERLLTDWSGPGWPDADAALRYRAAMLIPGVAHSCLEYHRWAVRSLARPDGARAARLLAGGVAAPTLHLHGALDSVLLPDTAKGSGRWARGGYEWQLLDGAGHYPHEEVPDLVTDAVLRWAGRAAGDRDRDPLGRPRSTRRRDPTGRPLPVGAAGDLPRGDDEPVPTPQAALRAAAELARAGRPFAAHEVLEAVWKAAPEPERELWRGLAQLMVGLTHVQRGNARGAAALLRRGSDRVDAYAAAPPYGIPIDALVAESRELADRVQRAGTVGLAAIALALPLDHSPLGKS